MNIIEELKALEEDKQFYNKRDRFFPFRLRWHCQVFRHLVHLEPGRRMLEIGCGNGEYSLELERISKGRLTIDSVTFNEEYYKKPLKSRKINLFLIKNLDQLQDVKYDYIFGGNILSSQIIGEWLIELFKLLKPGGKAVFLETNAWNPYLKLRWTLGRFIPGLKRKKEGIPLNKIELYEMLSEVNFTKVKIFPYDFVFPPIPRFLFSLVQQVSLILENIRGIKDLAGSIYIYAQKGLASEEKRGSLDLCNHESMKGKVSFMIPCFNEAQNIPSLVDGIKRYYDKYIHEIVIINDNSTDNTIDIVSQLKRNDPRVKLLDRHPPNGLGLALRDGFRAVTGEYVLTMDCDFEQILPEMEGLFDAVAAGADAAYGSRFSRESVLINYPVMKIIMNRGFHLLLQFFLPQRVRDVTNNLKLFRRKVVDNLVIESDDFAANAETGIKPIRMGYKVKEVPISWINRRPGMGSSSFRLFKTGPNYIRHLLALKTSSKGHNE